MPSARLYAHAADSLRQVAELYSRGWTETELAGLTCNNFLRVFEGAERVAHEMRVMGVEAATDLYDKRPDLPMRRSIAEIVLSFGTHDTELRENEDAYEVDGAL
jgi:hypothetical protein